MKSKRISKKSLCKHDLLEFLRNFPKKHNVLIIHLSPNTSMFIRRLHWRLFYKICFISNHNLMQKNFDIFRKIHWLFSFLQSLPPQFFRFYKLFKRQSCTFWYINIQSNLEKITRLNFKYFFCFYGSLSDLWRRNGWFLGKSATSYQCTPIKPIFRLDFSRLYIQIITQSIRKSLAPFCLSVWSHYTFNFIKLTYLGYPSRLSFVSLLTKQYSFLPPLNFP